MKKHLDLMIFGKVQQVGFRFWLADRADELHICGLAKNEREGSVLVEAEGEEEDLAAFKKLCQQGPSSAKVTSLESVEAKLKNYKDFRIMDQF